MAGVVIPGDVLTGYTLLIRGMRNIRSRACIVITTRQADARDAGDVGGGCANGSRFAKRKRRTPGSNGNSTQEDDPVQNWRTFNVESASFQPSSWFPEITSAR